MASVQSRTKVSIDQLINENVNGGSIDEFGQLILTTRGGGTINAGFIAKPFSSAWSYTQSYVIGDVVGYNGLLWRCKVSNTNKPPSMYTSMWTRLEGKSLDDWSEKDPFFTGDDRTESWEFFWKTGNPTVSLTTTAGEFETGKQALKIAMAASETQRFYQKEENIARGTETIMVSVRARASSITGAPYLQAAVLANDENGRPEPFAAGLSTAFAAEGNRALTTSWATYTFTLQAVSLKPRTNINLIAVAGTSAVNVMIDWVRIHRANGTPVATTPAPGVDNLQIANAEFVRDMLRGTIHDYAGATPPPGALICDGSAISRTDYAKLFAKIGTVHGVGDGSTTFNIPDTRFRLIVGANGNLGANDGLAVGSRQHALGHVHNHGPGTLATGNPTTDLYNNNTTGGSATRAGPFHKHDIETGTTANNAEFNHPRIYLHQIIYT